MQLIEAIEQTVQRYPTRIGLEDSQEQLTYQQMWTRAVQASKKLPRTEPGYLMLRRPRSCQLIVNLLAVWLAGHAPLLLDPDTPQRRMDELNQLVRPLGWANHRHSAGVEYLVTTSGSTGQPKVIKIPIGSLHNVIQYQIQEFQTDHTATVGWILSPGFDASFSDIGTALCSGARLLCFKSPYPDSLDQVTHLDIPPALLRVYRPGSFPSTLKTLVVGGEASHPSLLRDWGQHHRLVAVYGPSETTVCSSAAVVNQYWDDTYIGRPLPGVEYAVEDGELLIGGPNVGLGYLGDPSGFLVENGTRWYASGDRVASDHEEFGYRFRGRIDRQVQLRGQRFEPEEVEHRAAQVLQTEVACEVWQGQVVLCWQTLGRADKEEKKLRRVLRDHLLPAWLPLHYIPLREIPRSEVFKIDRGKLKALLSSWLTEQMTSLERLGLELNQEPLPTIKFQKPSVPKETYSSPPTSVLVTGLTGRLGRALEPHLQERFDVWSLHRGPDEERSFQVDLTTVDFGLTTEKWDFLKGKVDMVIHLAGQLDLSLDLESLRPLNVDSVSTLLSLDKPLYYASTLAVELSTQDRNVMGGYAQSKYLAERLLEETAGITWRYGHLIGHPRGDELLALVIEGLIELGCCPQHDDPRLCFDWTPLDWAAQQTVSQLKTSTNLRRIHSVRRGWHFHLNHLAQELHGAGLVELVDAQTFFAQTPIGRSSALAQTALWKCRGEPVAQSPFDLFLLGNSVELLGRSQFGPRARLAEYIFRVPRRISR